MLQKIFCFIFYSKLFYIDAIIIFPFFHLHFPCSLSKRVIWSSKFAGSVKSLISLPCFMSHASIPVEVREARGLTEDLVRISVGIEDVNDLIDDLDYALKTGPA
uniref:Cystathionine beta-lyase n=1 Tax=Solanum tuberosum TaxID=4113 RepID=M1CXA2_SOLTU